MEEIGGYFGLHLEIRDDIPYEGIYFNSGRSALEYFLRRRKPKELWIPEYICPSLLPVIKRLGIVLKRYRIDDQLYPLIDASVFGQKHTFVMIVNYFGVRGDLLKMFYKYRFKIIWDLSQAFYCKLPQEYSGFYSPRKFFGVSDGGILIGKEFNGVPKELPRAKALDKVIHLIKRVDAGASSGYADFKKSNRIIAQEGMMLMSNLTIKLMGSIDYAKASRQRLTNYRILHKYFASLNRLDLPRNLKAAPLVYPLKIENTIKANKLREYLINKKIFVARYWPFNNDDNFGREMHELSSQIIPLPIDQRYGREEMNTIISLFGGIYGK